jgi:hypothetical protein
MKKSAATSRKGVILREPRYRACVKEEESAVLRDLQQTLGKPVTVGPTHLHHEQLT